MKRTHITLVIAVLAAFCSSCNDRIEQDQTGAQLHISADTVVVYGNKLNIIVSCEDSKEMLLTYKVLDKGSADYEVPILIEHNPDKSDTIAVSIADHEFGHYNVAVSVHEDHGAKMTYQDTLSFRYLPQITATPLYYGETDVISYSISPASTETELSLVSSDGKAVIGDLSWNIVGAKAWASAPVTIKSVGDIAATIVYNGVEVPVSSPCHAKLSATFISSSTGNLAVRIFDDKKYGLRSFNAKASVSAYATMDYYADDQLSDAVLANIMFEEEGNKGRESSLHKQVHDTLSFSTSTPETNVEVLTAAGCGQFIFDGTLLDRIQDGHPSFRFKTFVNESQDGTSAQVPKFDTDWSYFIPSEFSIKLEIDALDGYFEISRNQDDLSTPPGSMTKDAWKKWVEALSVTITKAESGDK